MKQRVLILSMILIIMPLVSAADMLVTFESPSAAEAYVNAGDDRTLITTALVRDELTRTELGQLETNPDVVRIEYNHPIRAFLQDSVRIMNASRLWPMQLNNMNITGVGTTICIIDTGVNYNHSALGGCYGNNNISSPCKVVGGYDFANGDSDPFDDNGHGTYVAGIAAANGSIMGVAPGARIIAIKALDENGEGTTAELIAGINWCVGNASTYNISVISMSLGTTTLYTSTCDTISGFAQLNSSIQAALAQNISVIAATGNEGNGVARNRTAISSPACISNVTAVAATNKDDSFASYAHYNSLVQLVAPGTSINTTSGSSSYEPQSGTSMATPQVAGVLALMRQLTEASNTSRSPRDQVALLNRTGARVEEQGRIFSRVNVFDALSARIIQSIRLETSAVSLYTRFNYTYTCNATSTFTLGSLTLSIWNQTGSNLSITESVSGTINRSIISYNFTSEGNYTFSCSATSGMGFFVRNQTNTTLIYDLSPPQFETINPANASSLSNGTFGITTHERSACNYSLNGTANVSLMTANNLSFSVNTTDLVNLSTYTVQFYCTDLAGNTNQTGVQTFTYDPVLPVVESESPDSDTSYTGSTEVSFRFNVSDAGTLANCSLLLNDVITLTNTTLTNGSHRFVRTLEAGSYSWAVTCVDQASNLGISNSRSITVQSATSTGSSGGSGSSGGGRVQASTVQTVSASTLETGARVRLKPLQSVRFTIENMSHNLTLENSTSVGARFILRSSPYFFNLSVGESKLINLSSARYYDFQIELANSSTREVALVLRSVRVPLILPSPAPTSEGSESPVSPPIPEASNVPLDIVSPTTEHLSLRRIIAIIAGVSFCIILGLWWYRRHRRNRRHFHHSPEHHYVRHIHPPTHTAHHS